MPVVLLVSGILVCVYLLLTLPIIVTADLGGEPEVFLKWLCFKFRLYPKKPKTKKGKRGKSAKTSSKTDAKKKSRNKSISHYVDKYGDLLKAVLKSVGNLLKHLKINCLEVSVVVGDEDAAKVAVEYGAVCAVLYPVLGLLDSAIDIKQSEISIKPDYNSKTSNGRLYADVRIRVFHVLAAALNFIKYLYK